MSISGALTNLSAYNSGYLKFVWLNFPVSDEELNQAIKQIGNPEETFFSDWDNETSLRLGEYESIDEINELAEFFNCLNSDEEQRFNAICEHCGDFKEAKRIYENGDYQFYDDCHDESDLGFEIAQYWEIPEHLNFYIDYEKLGRDANINAVGGFYGNGFLEIY